MHPLLALLLQGFDITSLFTYLEQQRQKQRQEAMRRNLFNPPWLQQDDGGFGDGAPGSTKGTAESGKLSGQLGGLMSGFGALRGGVGALNTAMGLFGAAQPALGIFGLATTPIGVMNTASALFGGPPEYNIASQYGNLQDIADYQGYIAAAERQAQDQAMADALNSMVAQDLTGYANYAQGPGGIIGGVDMGSVSGGLAGVGQAPGDSGRNDGTSPGI